MAGISSSTILWRFPFTASPPRGIDRLRRCSTSPTEKGSETQTPTLLKIAVGGATELLRLFSPAGRDITVLSDDAELYDENEISISGTDDIVSIIRSDYGNAYFVTGQFTESIYADDCRFEDPTIVFRGKRLYARNLKLLVPFLENPSIELKSIDSGVASGREFIVASWKLTTHLKLPWKPLICVEGTTDYDLDKDFRIVKHVEKWDISAIDAIIQIFSTSISRKIDLKMRMRHVFSLLIYVNTFFVLVSPAQ